MNMKKSNVAWLFAVIVLSVFLVISLILGFGGFFSSVSYMHSNCDMSVGDKFSIAVYPNQASVASLTFEGSYLPNETIPQVVQINAQDLNSDVNVRVKARVFGLSKEIELDFVTTEHFEKADDGYYYFDDTLKGGNKITFSNYITFPQNGEFESGKKYILTIVAETLETKYGGENIWKNA